MLNEDAKFSGTGISIPLFMYVPPAVAAGGSVIRHRL